MILWRELLDTSRATEGSCSAWSLHAWILPSIVLPKMCLPHPSHTLTLLESLETVGWSLARFVKITRNLGTHPSSSCHSERAPVGGGWAVESCLLQHTTWLFPEPLILQSEHRLCVCPSYAHQLDPTFGRACRTTPCQKGTASPPLRLPPRSRSLIRSLGKHFHFPVSWPSGLLSNMLWEG